MMSEECRNVAQVDQFTFGSWIRIALPEEAGTILGGCGGPRRLHGDVPRVLGTGGAGAALPSDAGRRRGGGGAGPLAAGRAHQFVQGRGGGGSDTLPAAQQPWLAEVVASEAAAAAATAAAATATATAAAAAAASEADEGAPTANPILFTRPGITGTALSQHTYSDRVSTLYYVRCGCVIRAFGDC